jgi:peroxiredoxin family protein
MLLMQIVVTKGAYSDWQAAGLLASGAIAADYRVIVFAMNEAVWALRRDVIGTDTVLHSHFPEFQTKMAEGIALGKSEPWWKLLAELKHIGDLRIVACALVVEVLELTLDDLSDLVDEISGVAACAVTAQEADVTITL